MAQTVLHADRRLRGQILGTNYSRIVDLVDKSSGRRGDGEILAACEFSPARIQQVFLQIWNSAPNGRNKKLRFIDEFCATGGQTRGVVGLLYNELLKLSKKAPTQQVAA